MVIFKAPRFFGILQAGLVLATGTALADGGASTSAASDPIVARATYLCKGGVRVEVTQRTKTVRVDFAGRSRTLNLTGSSSGTVARNTQVSWVTRSGVASMKNDVSGQLELSGCRPTR